MFNSNCIPLFSDFKVLYKCCIISLHCEHLFSTCMLPYAVWSVCVSEGVFVCHTGDPAKVAELIVNHIGMCTHVEPCTRQGLDIPKEQAHLRGIPGPHCKTL